MAAERHKSTLRDADVRRRFDRAAPGFDGADFAHTVTRSGLLERLAPILIDARTVIDLGCATGSAGPQLAKRFRGAHIIAVDLSYGMLQSAYRKHPRFAKTSAVQANANALPFVAHSVDVVFANLLLPWIDDPTPVLDEVCRVLRKDGLFLFATLGPDSLVELRRAWQSVDDERHVNHFLDMHDLGDAAVQAGLRDPVLDVDHLAVTYADAGALFRDLTAVGGRNCLKHRNRSMLGKTRFAKMVEALNNNATDGIITLDLELVYGHCWGSGPRSPAGEYRIDPTHIGRVPH